MAGGRSVVKGASATQERLRICTLRAATGVLISREWGAKGACALLSQICCQTPAGSRKEVWPSSRLIRHKQLKSFVTYFSIYLSDPDVPIVPRN